MSWTLTTAGVVLTLATGIYTLAFAELQYLGCVGMQTERGLAATAHPQSPGCRVRRCV